MIDTAPPSRGLKLAVLANRGARLGFAVCALLLVVVLLDAISPKPVNRTLSASQRRSFAPVCASNGHLVSVTETSHVVGSVGASIFRVSCSGGLTVEVAR